MTPRLRPLAVLPGDRGSMPSTHVAVCNIGDFHSWGSDSPVYLRSHQAQMWCTDIYMQASTHTHNSNTFLKGRLLQDLLGTSITQESFIRKHIETLGEEPSVANAASQLRKLGIHGLWKGEMTQNWWGILEVQWSTAWPSWWHAFSEMVKFIVLSAINYAHKQRESKEGTVTEGTNKRPTSSASTYSVFLSLSLWLCPSLSLSFYLSQPLSLSLSISTSITVSLCLSVSLYLLVSISLCLCLCLSISASISASPPLSLCVSLSLSPSCVFVHVCLCVCVEKPAQGLAQAKLYLPLKGITSCFCFWTQHFLSSLFIFAWANFKMHPYSPGTQAGVGPEWKPRPAGPQGMWSST